MQTWLNTRIYPSCFDPHIKKTKSIIKKNYIIEYLPEIPKEFKIIVDTSEQVPYIPELRKKDIEIVRKSLDACDYSIAGHEDKFLVERKNPSDFLGSIGKRRLNFDKMWERARSAMFLGLLIECSEDEIYSPELFYSSISKNSIYGSIIAFEVKYNVHVYYGTREMCVQKLINWGVKFYNTLLENCKQKKETQSHD